MATTIEESGLTTRTEQSMEIVPTASAAAVEAEIRAAITVALKFPRNEDRAFEKLMKACQRPSFAEKASYKFPRGDSNVSGPSIYLAREAARVWGNIRDGFTVIADSDESRTIEAFAWDLETNRKITAQDTFRKLIYRKKGGWQKPDERDLRELTNKYAAMLKRNCLLEAIRKDFIDDARLMASQTLQSQAKGDPEAFRKRIIVKFSSIGVSADKLKEKLGHALDEATSEELTELNDVYASILDGNSTWAEYVDAQPKPQEKGKLNPEDLKPGKEENRGHGNEGLNQTAKPKAAQNPKSTPPKEAAPVQGSAAPAGNPKFADSEPDPFAPGGDLFGREPGSEG